MRRLLCRWLGHSVDSNVIEWIGGIYPRNWIWCGRCDHWYEVTRG